MPSSSGFRQKIKGLAAAAGAIFGGPSKPPQPGRKDVRIGVALGGGFARAVTHIGVLKVLERNKIPVHCISGVSAGAIVASAFASGATLEDTERLARSMRFKDVAGWSINVLGLANSERMDKFLDRALLVDRFEAMPKRLAIVATDLSSGRAIVFRDTGDVKNPIRASCSYPGLFQPVRLNGRLLVDGAIAMDLPAEPLHSMGATHVISVSLPTPLEVVDPGNLLGVVNRCLQILQRRTEGEWRKYSTVVLEPDVANVSWDGFEKAADMLAAGEAAAEAALPVIKSWMK